MSSTFGFLRTTSGINPSDSVKISFPRVPHTAGRAGAALNGLTKPMLQLVSS